MYELEKHNFEVITTDDKVQRDSIYEDLRNSDDPLERQVVKFSGNRHVVEAPDRIVRYAPGAEAQYREVCISTWSVAYPKS